MKKSAWGLVGILLLFVSFTVSAQDSIKWSEGDSKDGVNVSYSMQDCSNTEIVALRFENTTNKRQLVRFTVEVNSSRGSESRVFRQKLLQNETVILDCGTKVASRQVTQGGFSGVSSVKITIL